jgi:beta-glucosidase
MSGVHAPGVKNLDSAIAAAHHTALAHAEATRAMKAVNPTLRA